MNKKKILNCDTCYKVFEEKNTDRYIEVTGFRRGDYNNLFQAAEKG